MNRSRQRWALIAAIFVVIIIAIWFYFNDERQVDGNLINQDITLQNSVAAVLYSSSVPYETDGVGKSYLIFISEDGEINTIKGEGLELNSLILAKDTLILNEKDKVLTINSDHVITEEPLTQCKVISGYGQSSGYLPKAGYYYSLYNHKFMENAPKYLSYIRWGNETGQNCQEITEYIETTGQDGEKIYLITSDLFDPGVTSLVEIVIEEGSIKENQYVLTRENIYDRIYFTNIVSDDRHLYLIVADFLEDKAQLKLVQIDKNARQIVHIFSLHEYSLTEGTKYFFFNRDSIDLQDGQIYFVDGYGDVYGFDLVKQELHHLFRFENYQRKDYMVDEQVFFYDDSLFFFRYDEEQKVHIIEEYSINGERLKLIQIPNIKDIIHEKGIFIYDFKILSLHRSP